MRELQQAELLYWIVGWTQFTCTPDSCTFDACPLRLLMIPDMPSYHFQHYIKNNHTRNIFLYRLPYFVDVAQEPCLCFSQSIVRVIIYHRNWEQFSTFYPMHFPLEIVYLGVLQSGLSSYAQNRKEKCQNWYSDLLSHWSHNEILLDYDYLCSWISWDYFLGSMICLL